MLLPAFIPCPATSLLLDAFAGSYHETSWPEPGDGQGEHVNGLDAFRIHQHATLQAWLQSGRAWQPQCSLTALLLVLEEAGRSC